MENNNITTTDNGKVAAILSYFGILWLVAYFALHKDKKTALASYHLRQTLLFTIVSTVIVFILTMFLTILIVATGIAAIAYVGTLIYLALFVIWLVGLIGAINGQQKPMPLIGEKAQTMFPSI